MDLQDLEKELNISRANLDKVLSNPSGKQFEEFERLDNDCLVLERRIAELKGEEFALEIEWALPWDLGAPLPHVLSSGLKTILIYYRSTIDTEFDGTYVNESDPIRDDLFPLALVEFEKCIIHKFGGPNDEVFQGHPLTGKGFGGYGAYVVKNSNWIAEQKKIKSVHQYYDPSNWDSYRHYFLAFHDEIFECIAEKHSYTELNGTFSEALEIVKEKIVSN